MKQTLSALNKEPNSVMHKEKKEEIPEPSSGLMKKLYNYLCFSENGDVNIHFTTMATNH